MKRIPAAAALVALAACVSLPVERTPAAAPVTTARAVHLARVRCLLVAPFENASDDPVAAEAATGTWVSAIDGNRTSIYPIAELRSLFKDTSLELPEGVSPSLALELAELIGADAALYGAVEGRSRGPDAELSVTIRLAASGARDLLFSRVITLRPSPDLPLADQVRRAVLDASAPVLERLGVPGRKACFDRQRTDRLRLMAIAGEQRVLYPPAKPVTATLPPAPPPAENAAGQAATGSWVPEAVLPAPPAPPQMAEIGEFEILPAFPRVPRSTAPLQVESAADLPEVAAPKAPEPAPSPSPEPPRDAPPPEPPVVAKDAPPAKQGRLQRSAKTGREAKVTVAKATPVGSDVEPASKAKPLTPRQAAWLARLQGGKRVAPEEVSFVGRTGLLEREAGLVDVAALLAVAPGLKLRIEGFVDSSNDPDGDLRTSMEMARAAGRRLIELGVARDRLTWAGRGGDSPILPNFTARGRQSNRRIELLPAK